MNLLDVLERASDGQLVDMRKFDLSAEDLCGFAAWSTRTCADCFGTGICGIAIGEALGMIGMMPIPCPSCNGEGQHPYTAMN